MGRCHQDHGQPPRRGIRARDRMSARGRAAEELGIAHDSPVDNDVEELGIAHGAPRRTAGWTRSAEPSQAACEARGGAIS